MQFDPVLDKTLIHYFGLQWGVKHLDQAKSMPEELDFSFTEVPADFFSMMQERNSVGKIVKQSQHIDDLFAWGRGDAEYYQVPSLASLAGDMECVDARADVPPVWHP